MDIQASFSTIGGERIIVTANDANSATTHLLSHDDAQTLSSQVGEALEAMARHRLAKSTLHPSAKGAPVVELGS